LKIISIQSSSTQKFKTTMPGEKKSLRTCPRGHQYTKSSDCPICPVCEGERKPGNGFLSLLPAPARRALENEDITSLEILSAHSETEILTLHWMGHHRSQNYASLWKWKV
jgi:hypothetical protein